MKIILKFYIEVLMAGILCAVFGLINLFRIDFIRPDGVIFVYLPLLLPMVIVAFRSGLMGSVPCALIGSVLLYVSKGSGYPAPANFFEIFASLGLASLVGFLKTYSKTPLKRVMMAGLIAEGSRFLCLTIGAAFYTGTFRAESLGPALIDHLYFLSPDLCIMLGLLALGYVLTKGSLYEYKI